MIIDDYYYSTFLYCFEQHRVNDLSVHYGLRNCYENIQIFAAVV